MIGGQRLKENLVLTNDLTFEIAKNNISGYSVMRASGERLSLAVVGKGSDVWNGTGIKIPIPNQIGGEMVRILSTNHDDRLSGTGVNKVRLYYLDATGNEQVETINLNGTAFVNSTGTNIRFIQDFFSSVTGVGDVASGTVSVTAYGTSDKVYMEIPANLNVHMSTQKMIPNNKTLYLTKWNVSVSQQRSQVRLRSTTFGGTRFGTTFIIQDSFVGNNSSLTKEFKVPVKIPEFSILKISAWTDNAGGNVSADWEGILVDNS